MDKIFSNIKERILYLTDYYNVSKELFFKNIGMTYGNFKGSAKERPLNSDSIVKILSIYPEINAEWLLTGIGNMIKNEDKIYAVKRKLEPQLIPLYDGFMTASRISQDIPALVEPIEMVDAGDWFRDATGAMRVHGDSMFPDYVSGSIVAMKEVFNKRLLVYGQDYLIETSEYRVLKRLQKSDLADSWLLCSTNSEIWEVGAMKNRLVHEPFDIHQDDVTKICLVLGSIKRNHSSRIVDL